MGFERFMAAQARQPSAWFGYLVLSRVMNRVKCPIIETTNALLQIQPQHHLLEIEFGGSFALTLPAQRVISGAISVGRCFLEWM